MIYDNIGARLSFFSGTRYKVNEEISKLSGRLIKISLQPWPIDKNVDVAFNPMVILTMQKYLMNLEKSELIYYVK